MRDPMLAVERNIQDQISDDPWRAMLSASCIAGLKPSRANQKPAPKVEPKREWR